MFELELDPERLHKALKQLSTSPSTTEVPVGQTWEGYPILLIRSRQQGLVRVAVMMSSRQQVRIRPTASLHSSPSLSFAVLGGALGAALGGPAGALVGSVLAGILGYSISRPAEARKGFGSEAA